MKGCFIFAVLKSLASFRFSVLSGYSARPGTSSLVSFLFYCILYLHNDKILIKICRTYFQVPKLLDIQFRIKHTIRLKNSNEDSTVILRFEKSQAGFGH